ncbi:MAG: DMT family transporter [Cyclobacteriaceae bacterium]
MDKNRALAWILLLILALIWGSSFILIKKGLVGLSPYELGSLRIVAAMLFLLPSALKRFKHVDKKSIPFLISVGLLGSLVPSFLFGIAQTKLESSITGVINGLTPIFVILIGLFIYKQRQASKVFLGIFVGFLGTAVLISAGKGMSLSGINVYALLVVLATVCYGTNLNFIKYHLGHLHPITVTSVSLILVGPAAVVHLFGFTEFLPKLTSPEGIGLSTFYVCVLGIFGTAIALILFNKILQITDALFASSVTYLIPVVAVIWGVLDGESLYLMHYVGMIAVGIGVYIANSNRAAHKKKGNTE